MSEQKSRSFDRSGDDEIPLTRAQKLIWLGQRLNPSTPLYNMAMTFRYRFRLEESRFQAAFDRLVSEEETLRLIVSGDGEDVALRTHEGSSPTLNRLDMADDDAFEDVVKDWVQRSFRDNEPLTRSVLIKHDDADWTWLLVQHHLVTDVATFFLLHQRLAALYGGDDTGGEGKDPNDWPSFRAYAEFESKRANSESMREARQRCRERVCDYPGAFSYERIGDVPSWRSERWQCPLPSPLRQGEAFGDALGSTMWTLAVFFTVLYRLNGVSRPVIGVPLHNRTSPKRRQTAGMLVEVVPLSVEVSDDDTLADVHHRVVTAFTGLVKSGTVGLADAVAIGSVDCVLNVINAPDLKLGEHAVECTWRHCDATDPSHVLRVHIWRGESEDCGQLLFDVRSDTLSAPRREDFVAIFLNVLKQAALDSGQRVGDVSLLPPSEQERQLVRATGPRVPGEFDGGLLGRFRVAATRHADAIALTQGSDQMTFAELDHASDQVAAALQQSDVGKGDRVAVWRPRSIDAVVDILGIMKSGAAFTVFDTALPLRRIEALMRELGSDGRSVPVLTAPDRRDEVVAMGGSLVRMDAGDNYRSVTAAPEDCCYVLFTSGSTGTPKGVMVSHGAITDYIDWAGRVYEIDAAVRFGLFTSLAFDLTLTSLFLPLVHGGTLRVYPSGESADVAVTDAVAENQISFAKITPSHLAFWSDEDLRRTAITRWVIGGEDLKTSQARRIAQSSGEARVFNEYGPTEATVACMIHEFDPHADLKASVPIGGAADNHDIFLLDEKQRPVPDESVGEIYIGGAGVAQGYLNRPIDTQRRFIASPFGEGTLYRTGDLARWDRHNRLHYLGRTDRQVKVSGVRLELGEIENVLQSYPGVTQAVVETLGTEQLVARGGERFCNSCGLSEKYPNAVIDASGVCSICHRFQQQEERVMGWFGTEADFARIAARMKSEATGDHDCIVLFSGGKDSTYMLYQLVNLGLRPIALTLENGYLSKQAKDNISRAVQDLGVDHEYLDTPYMDRIFADSLKTFNNVCNGCFKTIYTLSTQYALERNIGYIVTGLSRGQLFETRLDDLFDRDDVPVDAYDDLIASARKAYHRQDDLISKCLDGAVFQDDTAFDKVQFVDFYRYVDVPLTEVYAFLESRAPWVRPTDTGRSTNCLINDTGIFVHTRQTGYHNYALPYSWDVRLGHKTRAEALEELNDQIDTDSVKRNLQQIGYDRALFGLNHLAAWIVGDDVDVERLKRWLQDQLPAYALPDTITSVDQLPLTANGKVDLDRLKKSVVSTSDTDGEPCRAGTESLLADAWLEVLGHSAAVFRNSHFFSLGGDSMAAILLVSELRKRDLSISLDQVFDAPRLSDMAMRVVALDPASVESDFDDDLGLDLGEGEVEQLAEKIRPLTP